MASLWFQQIGQGILHGGENGTSGHLPGHELPKGLAPGYIFHTSKYPINNKNTFGKFQSAKKDSPVGDDVVGMSPSTDRQIISYRIM